MEQVAVVTHSEAIYDKRGAIAQAISNLSGLEQILITSQSNRLQGSINSADGCLKADEAQNLVNRYDVISLFGGCLNVCHYRTYESLVKAFKNSPKKKLTIKFSLDGIFGDYFPSIDVTFNLNEILEFNDDVDNREAREQAVLSLFEKY